MKLEIPVELRYHCINFLDNDVQLLKAVRLSCKDLSTLATQTLFQTAVLNHNEKSAEKFKKLIKSPLESLVHRVIINTRGISRWRLETEIVARLWNCSHRQRN
jgi:hypothetical protein